MLPRIPKWQTPNLEFLENRYIKLRFCVMSSAAQSGYTKILISCSGLLMTFLYIKVSWRFDSF